MTAPPSTPARSTRQPIPRDDESSHQVTGSTDINRTIDGLVAHVQKKFGADSISRLGDAFDDVLGTFDTGLPNLNEAIGIGGFPLAKLVQIAGPKSVGKSALCKKLIARCQTQGIIPYFIDGEMSKDTPERYVALDISTSSVAWSETMYLEDAFGQADEAIVWLAKKDKPSIIFMDSIAAFMMRADEDRKYEEEGRRAAKASFLAKNLPKLVHKLKGTQIGMVFVNQLRQSANAMPFADPFYEPGGMALAHWCHLILRMNPLGQIKQGDVAIGVKARIAIRKSKLAAPLRRADVSVFFDGRIEPLEGDD